MLRTLQQLFHFMKVVDTQLLHLAVFTTGKQGATPLIGEQFPSYACQGTERHGRHSTLQRAVNGLQHGTTRPQPCLFGSPGVQQILQSRTIEKGQDFPVVREAAKGIKTHQLVHPEPDGTPLCTTR